MASSASEDAIVLPKYVVNLSAVERDTLTQLVPAGMGGAQALTRARLLLKAAEGLSDSEVAAALDVGVATVHRIRQRCVEGARVRPPLALSASARTSPSAKRRFERATNLGTRGYEAARRLSAGGLCDSVANMQRGSAAVA